MITFKKKKARSSVKSDRLYEFNYAEYKKHFEKTAEGRGFVKYTKDYFKSKLHESKMHDKYYLVSTNLTHRFIKHNTKITLSLTSPEQDYTTLLLHKSLNTLI